MRPLVDLQDLSLEAKEYLTGRGITTVEHAVFFLMERIEEVPDAHSAEVLDGDTICAWLKELTSVIPEEELESLQTEHNTFKPTRYAMGLLPSEIDETNIPQEEALSPGVELETKDSSDTELPDADPNPSEENATSQGAKVSDESDKATEAGVAEDKAKKVPGEDVEDKTGNEDEETSRV